MKIIGLIILIILSVLALCLAVCLFVKIRLIVNFVKPRDGKSKAEVRLELFSGRVIKKLDNVVDKAAHAEHKKGEDQKYDKLSFSQKVKKYYPVFRRIRYTWLKSKAKVRKNIFAEKLELNVTFGLEDADQTGIATGSMWAAAYNVIAFAANFVRITEPQIHINPVYDEELCEADGECIVTFRIVNIISILISVGINYYFINRKLSKKEKAAINYVNTD